MRNLVLSNDELKFKITPTYKHLNLPPLYHLNSKLKVTHPLYSYTKFRNELSNFDYFNGIYSTAIEKNYLFVSIQLIIFIFK